MSTTEQPDPSPAEEKPAEVLEAEDLQSAFAKVQQKRPEVVSEFMAMMASGPMMNPIYQKMDGDHVTKVLEIAASHDEREYTLHKASHDAVASDRVSNRRYFFATFIAVVVVFLVLLFSLQDKPEILIPAMTGLGGLVSGFLGGWGFGRRSSD